MAKIYLRGKLQPIEVSKKDAETVRSIFLNENAKADSKIDLKFTVFEKRDIKEIELDKEFVDREEYGGLRRYLDGRAKLMAMLSRERAEKNSWGHFVLFYYGLKGENPPESMKQEVIDYAEKFFKKYDKWCMPSIWCWYHFLNLDENFMLEGNVLRIMERVEHQEENESGQRVQRPHEIKEKEVSVI